MKDFTNEEIEWLKENYANLGGKACAERLNRSFSSVRHKMSRLSIKKYEKLKQVDGKTICSFCKNELPTEEFSKRKDGSTRRVCKACRASKQAFYYDSKREWTNNRQNIRLKKLKKENPNFALITRIRCRIRTILKQNKTRSSIEYLGCSLDEFKAYIESKFKEGMSWQNMNLWHLDHIKPCSLFDLSKPEERDACFHYSNIQPLWAKDNLSKRNLFIG